MTARYLLAIVLTVVLLGIARRMSTRRPGEIQISSGDVSISHTTVTENFGDGPIIELKISAVDSLRPMVLYSEQAGSPYQSMEMVLGANGYYARLPALDKGRKWYYHIDIYRVNAIIATIPVSGDQFIKFKGHVSPFVLIPHIACMFATIFFGLLTVFTAVDYSRGRGELKRSVKFLFLTIVFSFIGGFPLGYLVAYQAFGQGWAGIPVGWDITDNKTVILFLFWLISFIIAFRGLKSGSSGIDPRKYLLLVGLSFFVTILTFLIPHSI